VLSAIRQSHRKKQTLITPTNTMGIITTVMDKYSGRNLEIEKLFTMRVWKNNRKTSTSCDR
jgi:hypothetical protein